MFLRSGVGAFFLIVRCRKSFLELVGLETSAILQKPDPIDQEWETMRKPASEEITTDSVELCETEVRFLHIQHVGTNVRLPKIHRIHPEVDLESSTSPEKSESWGKNQSTMLRRTTHMAILSMVTRVLNVEQNV